MNGQKREKSDHGCMTCDLGALTGQGQSPFSYFNYSVSRTAFTANQNQQLTIPFFPDSYFVIKKLIASSTSTFTTRIYNSSTGRVLSDTRVGNANLFGTVQLPNRLIDPIIVPPSSKLLLDMTDTSGSGNTIQPVLHGYRYFDMAKPPRFWGPGLALQWYMISAEITLSGNGQGIVQTQVDADADFLVRKLVGTQTGNYTIKISDSSSKDSWFDREQQNANAVGTAQYPAVLAKPKLVKANSAITTEFLDLSGSSNTIQVIFEGAKIYRG